VREPVGTVDGSATSTNPFRTLPRFIRAALTIAPKTIAETAVVTLVLSATEGIGLLMLVPLLVLVGVDAGQGSLNRLSEVCAAAFQSVGLRPTLGIVLLVYLAIVALQCLLQLRETALSARVQQDIVTTMRNRVYRAIAGTRWSYFARTRSSDFTGLLSEEVERLGNAAHYLVDIVVTSLTTIVYVALAFRVSPAMTAFVLLCGAAIAVGVRGKFSQARARGEATSASWSRLYAAIADHIGSLRIAKSYGAERRHTEEFERLSHDLGAVARSTMVSYSRFRQQLAMGSAVVLAAIVWVSYTILAVSTGQLLLLLFLFARLMPKLTGIYEKAQAFATMLPAFDAVTAIEDRCLAEAEPVVAQAAPVEFARRIDFEHVSFDYRGDGRTYAVRDATFAIAAGATTAIVGPSGSGKSTMADLLLGLLSPTEGRILIDGVVLGPDRIDAWRRQIGYVAQDTFLFHTSVRANLAWAFADANEDDMWRALRLASADAFVRALPNGLDTVVGDRGVLVSGGERQRLSLARALLRRPALLVLDEATSSLDSENESRIQGAIDELHQQMSIVIITHRLSTIRSADLVHVMDRGQLVESGTWTELAGRRGGRFRDLCQAQRLTNDESAQLDDARVAAGSARRRFEVVRS
jgi:ATP-binding cassette subfamily C protein